MGYKLKHIKNRIQEGLLKEIFHNTKWVYQYARYYWRPMILYTLMGLAGTAITLISSLISKDLVDIITKHQKGSLIKTFSLFIIFSITSLLINQVTNYLSSKISIRVDNEIKSDIFNKILITDWESITTYHTGDLLTRWNVDSSVISNGILNWLPNVIINTVRFLSSFAIMIYYDVTFALFALGGLPITILMSRSLLNRMQDSNKQSASMNAKMSGFNQETFSNIQTIKAFDLIHTYSIRLKQIQQEYVSLRMKYQKLSMISAIIMSLVGIIITNICYAWGIYRVWSGVITYGTMTLFLSLSSNMSGNLNSLISLIPNTLSISISTSRIRDILEMPREDFSDENKVTQLYERYGKEGISLTINNLEYAYHNGSSVFKNASLEAHPHEIIALVGPSGEGKTTLLRILLALLHPQNSQNYLYGGKNKASSIKISPATRKLFSYVPQGNTMFSGTIAENMRNVKPQAKDEEIIHALQMACAWEFVQKLPQGINSIIGERGGGFSEGQSQRLSLARALLRKSPILLLDEATSALDIATEKKVLENIMCDAYPRTCIITTHRPSVLNICHKVYALRDKAIYPVEKEEINQYF